MALAASQMRAVLSLDAVTMRDPSGLKAAEFTALMAAQDRDLLATGGVPDAGGPILRRRDDARPIGAEGGGIHLALWRLQNRDLLATRGVPIRAVWSLRP